MAYGPVKWIYFDYIWHGISNNHPKTSIKVPSSYSCRSFQMGSLCYRDKRASHIFFFLIKDIQTRCRHRTLQIRSYIPCFSLNIYCREHISNLYILSSRDSIVHTVLPLGYELQSQRLVTRFPEEASIFFA